MKFSLAAAFIMFISVMLPQSAAAQASCEWVDIGRQNNAICSTENATSNPNECNTSTQNTTVEGHYSSTIYCNTIYRCTCTNTTPTPTPQAGVCGTNASGVSYAPPGVAFPYGTSGYPSAQCSVGTPSTTQFPSPNTTVNWTCSGVNGGASASCLASQQAAPAPQTAPDLTPDLMGASSYSITPGQNVNFEARVSNIGAGAANNFPNMFQIADNALSSTIARVGASTLSLAGKTNNATDSAMMYGNYTFNTAATYKVRACANYDTNGSPGISESNGGNNCSDWVSIVVSAAPVVLSDLTAGSVTTSETATIGANQIYSATVSNIGSGPAGDFPMLWQERDSTTGPWRDIGADSYRGILSSGGSTVTSIQHRFSTAGTKYLRVCADQANGNMDNTNVPETNENNNCGPETAFTPVGPSVQLWFQ